MFECYLGIIIVFCVLIHEVVLMIQAPWEQISGVQNHWANLKLMPVSEVRMRMSATLDSSPRDRMCSTFSRSRFCLHVPLGVKII